MKQYPKLEIRLDRWDVGNYKAEMVLRLPVDEASRSVLDKDAPLVQITPSEFMQPKYLTNVLDYGQDLSKCLFGRKEVPGPPTAMSQAWVQATSQAAGEPLRVVLHLGGGAQDLRSLHWEKLMDPEGKVFLARGEQVFFSRFLSSGSTTGIRPLGKAELRALAVVANPEDLSRWPSGGQTLTRLDDVRGVLTKVKEAMKLGEIGMDSLPEDPAGGGERATLTQLITSLQKGYDILYLVCHGGFKEEEPVLYLEDEKGQVAPTSAFELIRRLGECLQLPRLVVLASCQSGGRGEGSETDGNTALVALGPRLVDAGVPAVLAMQGNITIETVEQFMPVFFRELAQEGQIDRAVAIARSQVGEEKPDWWAPALFMRLESGALWYEPGFKGKDLKRWPALLSSIKGKRCTPVLGMGLSEPVLGCGREIAKAWATKFNYPLARFQQEDLPQVAQFLSITQDPAYLQDVLKDYWREAILKRFGDHLPPEIRTGEVANLEELRPMISAAGKLSRESETEPHLILARLPFTTYISANPTSLLADALVQAGKTPQVFFYRWREELFEPVILAKEPTEQEPLVYQLFGSLEDPDSLVLTMDDYFDYLIAISRNMAKATRPIPTEVTKALTDNSLLLLGFQLDDWSFWVLFRFLMSLEGGRGKELSHVAAQIRPEVGRFRIPEDASTYLENYFVSGSKTIKMSIYWGSFQEFVKDLQTNWGGMGK